MDLEEVLHKLEEAKDSVDWDMVEDCIESIRVLIDDFDEYQSEEEWSWNCRGTARRWPHLQCGEFTRL